MDNTKVQIKYNMSKVASAARYEFVDDFIRRLVIITMVIPLPITPITMIIGTKTLCIQNLDWSLNAAYGLLSNSLINWFNVALQLKSDEQFWWAIVWLNKNIVTDEPVEEVTDKLLDVIIILIFSKLNELNTIQITIKSLIKLVSISLMSWCHS